VNRQNNAFSKQLALCLLALFLVACRDEPTSTPQPSAGQATLPPPPTASTELAPTEAAPTEVPTSEAAPTEPAPIETATATPAPLFEPGFEPSNCSFLQLTSSSYSLECGYLTVLENREYIDGRQIKLPIAIFKSRNSDPQPDPLIYVAPAGGFTVLPIAQYFMPMFGDSIYEQLLYDQAKRNDLNDEEKIAERVEFLRLCAQGLKDEGLELEMYSSTTNAADLNDLIGALGLEQASIYGLSYGSNVGLALLRDHPDVVRSIILDSVYPPQVAMTSSRTPNAYLTFEKVFSACFENEECNQSYPDLGAIIYSLIERLNEQPVSTTVTGWETFIEGGIFSEAIYTLLISGKVEDIPKAIYEANSGDFSRVERHIPDISNDPQKLDTNSNNFRGS